MKRAGRFRKWLGNVLIGLSGIILLFTVLLCCRVGKGVRAKGLRNMQQGFSDGAALTREFAPCCKALAADTFPNLRHTMHELRTAMKVLTPVADFTVAATEFKVVSIQPFAEYRQPMQDFRKAVPVMQNAAAAADQELLRLQRCFPSDSGEKLQRIGALLEETAALTELCAELHFLLIPVLFFFGLLLTLLTLLHGLLLRNGLYSGRYGAGSRLDREKD